MNSTRFLVSSVVSNPTNNRLLPVLFPPLSPLQSAWGTCPARCAAKKARAASRNRGGKAPGQKLGIKVREGQLVRANQILVRQKFSFRWMPGQYVIAGYKRTLNAQVDGHVHISYERWSPKPTDDWSTNVAPTLTDHTMQRRFVNIIPAPQVGRFRLVDQI